MTVTQILSCIIAPVLMPLFTRREDWKVKVYFVCSAHYARPSLVFLSSSTCVNSNA